MKRFFTFILIVIATIDLSAQDTLVIKVRKPNGSVTKVADINPKWINAKWSTFNDYISQNVRFPHEEIKPGFEQVTVLVQYVIDTEGIVKDVKIAKSSGIDKFDIEALRVMKNCPNWFPGIQNGTKISFKTMAPIKFTLK